MVFQLGDAFSTIKMRLLHEPVVRVWNWPNAHRCAFVIRDDDTSAFTEPQMLENVYANAWTNKFIVSMCLIPYIKARNNMDIPPSARDQRSYRRLDENGELMTYLIRKIKKRQIDIVQHGLTHEKIDSNPEFQALDYQRAKDRLLKGGKLIKAALNVQPRVFVAPWERISKTATSAIVDCGYSYNSLVSPGHTKAPSKMPNPIPYNLSGNSLFIPRSLSLFSRFYRIDKNIKRIKDQILHCYKLGGCAVLVAHHWEFYHDWADLDSRLVKAFNTILNFVEKLNVWKTSLGCIAEWWLRKEKLSINLHRSKKEILAEITSPNAGIPEGLTLQLKIPPDVHVTNVTSGENEFTQVHHEYTQYEEFLLSLKTIKETKKTCKVTIELAK